MPEINPEKQQRTARHEPGHVVIAADQGRRILPEGIMVDQSGFGLGCYDRDHGGSDASRKRILLATFAGYYAERRFCEEHGFHIPDAETWFVWNCDGKEAAKLLDTIGVENLAHGSVPATQSELRIQSDNLVGRRWNVIEAIAGALLAKSWEDIKPLPSGGQWWKDGQTMAKYLSGQEVVDILASYGMSASL